MGQQYENQSRDRALQNRFTAYLQIALRRKRRDYIQKRLRKDVHEFPTDFQETAFADGSNSDFGGTCRDLSQMEDSALSQALSGLTVRERFILFERVLNDRGYDELAEALGLRYNGVVSAYHRMIKKLRKELRGEGK